MSAETSPLERVLRRDGAVTIAVLVLLWLLTTVYVVAGAGLGMNAWDMTRMALLPQHHAAPLGDMSSMDMSYMTATWDPAHWALMVGMWWTMMIAMMIPSAAPTILLYARVHRHSQPQGQPTATAPPIAAFVAGYFLMWLAFSVLATELQRWLENAGILSTMTMGSRVSWLSGATLIAAGLYQLSPLKNACLAQCRAPAAFLSRHWRPGAAGALRLGLVHGAFCLGCCWMLMALLFVGGVMNLAWIAALTALVLAEKVLPAGRWVGYATGVLLIVWGVVILL